jgi:hypothetical protein
MENRVQNKIRTFRIPGYAIRTDQCTSIILKIHQRSTTGILTFLCYRLLGRHPNLLKRKGGTCATRQQGAGEAPRSEHQIEAEEM